MDFFKKAFGKKTDPENLPRFHHYAFVHTILKELFFGDSQQLIKVFSSPEGKQTFVNLWEKVGSDIENADKLPAIGLDVQYYEIEDYKISLLKMPQPERVTEAYFIAMIIGPDGIYYYTLEHTYGPDPVICFWENETHGNTGKHIKTDSKLFVDTVLEIINK